MTHAIEDVRLFYQELPFNYRETAEDHVAAINNHGSFRSYPMLRDHLDESTTVLDVGSGAGWFSNYVAYHFGSKVLGIDFTQAAVDRAADVARKLAINTEFRVADLFTFEPETRFDLVVSLGVLHHTDNCLAGVERIFERFVAPNGHVLIGLYHKYGRQPFLDHFREFKNKGATNAEMLDEYGRLHSQLRDAKHIESWFRDQVMHPHETQHTLKEVLPILARTKATLLSTSINRFEPFSSTDVLLEEEKFLLELGQERLKAGLYFPGFFVFFARKMPQ